MFLETNEEIIHQKGFSSSSSGWSWANTNQLLERIAGSFRVTVPMSWLMIIQQIATEKFIH